jgi:Ca2+-binding RTX toxin-like protein
MPYPTTTILVPFLHGRGSANESTITTTLVIFDSQVADLPLLYNALLPGSIAHTIQPHQDSIDHITHLLTQTGATKLAIVTHGQPGSIQIGNGQIDRATLEARSGLLQEWGVDSIALYSCEVGMDGEFVNRFAELTGAKIAASTSKLGAGNWELDGGMELLEIDRLVDYSSTLATFTGTTGDDGANVGLPFFLAFINGFTGGTLTELTDPDGDIFYAGDGNDYVNAGSGSDIINGGTGNDTLYGNSGSDRIDGGDGINILDGGDGDDRITTYSMRDTIDGGTGNDFLEIYAPTPNDAYTVEFTGANAGKSKTNGVQTGTFTGIELFYFVGDNGNDVINAAAANLIVALGYDYGLNIFGYGGSDTVLGSDGRDQIYGGNDNDFLYGQGGDDLIGGGAGFDIIFGGSGGDLIYGGSLNDTIFGGTEGDGIYGDDGEDYILGEDGNDGISGGNGLDIIYGGSGADYLSGNDGNDTIFGGTEDDTIDGNDGEDYLFGEDGNDTIKGGYGFDVIYGQAGNDTIYGEGLNIAVNGADLTVAPATGVGINDTIFGGIGSDEIWGGIGDDVLLGEEDNDTLIGQGGNDFIYGGIGRDFILGEEGNDFLDGGAGDDSLRGGDGIDTIFGVEGDDTIYGGAGVDYLYGGNGNDDLTGNDGSDFLIGGAGSDKFRYTAMTDAGDIITDFTAGVGGDNIDLTSLFNTILGVGHTVASVNTNYLKFTQSGANTICQVDSSGTGSAFVAMATLNNVTASQLSVAAGNVFV